MTFCPNIQVSLKQDVWVLQNSCEVKLNKQMNIQQFWKLSKKRQKDFNMHVHSSQNDVNKMHQNLVTIVVMTYTLSKLRVDIKVNIFNMKVKN